MAKIIKWRGKYAVDYRDGGGARHRPSFRTLREAREFMSEAFKEMRQPTQPACDPNITIEDYSKRWLSIVGATLKPSTLRSYELSIRRHLVPALGAMRVRLLVRGRIRALLTEKLTKPQPSAKKDKPAKMLSRSSVRIIHACLRAMLNAAVEDGIILANPADKLGRSLRLSTAAKYRESEIKALDREQLSAFLKTAAEVEPRYYELFFLMARTGLRLGEAFGLKWQDLDFRRRELHVERAIQRGVIGSTKSGRSRRVDMSAALVELLQRLQIDRKEETLFRGWSQVPEWIFTSEIGTPLDQSHTSGAFKRVLKHAKLPLHFHPHCLRHSFASLLLQQGESPAYVQRQLGHASIQLTVDTYGRWLPMGNKAAVDKLDDADQAEAVRSGITLVSVGGVRAPRGSVSPRKHWSRRSGLNRRPADYESAALPLSYAGVPSRGSIQMMPLPRAVMVSPVRRGCQEISLLW